MALAASASTLSSVVTGKILHKETRAPLADLLVELFELDDWADPEIGESPGARDAASIARNPRSLIGDDLSMLYKIGKRTGSTVTSGSGQFALELASRDINLPRRNEQRADLILVVLAPDEPGLHVNDRLLHLSMDIRFNAGSAEAHVVLIPTGILKKHGVPVPEAPPVGEARSRAQVDAYVNEKQREKEFNAGAAGYHGAEAERESVERKTFRSAFVKTVVTDLAAVPVRGVMAGETDNIADKNRETIEGGVQRANAMLAATNTNGVPVNLYLTPDDRQRLAPFFNGVATGYVDIPDSDLGDVLFRTNSTENPGTLLIHNNPIASFCAAESEDERCAKLHTNGPHAHGGEVLPPAPTSPGFNSATGDDVLGYVDRLLRDIPAPDMVLRPELAPKRTGQDVAAAVNAFSLQKGPAEVPAFYDFHSVQVAFDHVWRQLFDEAIPNLAYTANQLGKRKFGVQDVVGNLRNALLTNGLFFTISPVEVPASVARLFDITKEEFNEMSFANRQQLEQIAAQIHECTVTTHVNFNQWTLKHGGSKITDLRIIQSLTEQGERLIDMVRHDDYHTLHRTLRDLHERLNAKYEFTVFAADKDYHSVNFGLLNTYRQQWIPLNYQAGKLVKTIPLAPKEERKYSVKVNRHDKRSVKEARKNNTSITGEQTTTSKVEADIMAKAQNKTNFGVTAEGDFNVGIYNGKGTTTFGVEAISESAQNRKDFREAVVKAVQDYKNETSTEVTTDYDETTESLTSGTIANPNDALSFTCLFYELQKRFRISEQIYRVMPVVMVAQPMPRPDEITPAWVLAHDWILNRHLLDDSFRPTLRYIANNSVGDDFSLRELRKNLRQQRNLVDTLRIEFSAASMQADNRYAALEAQIARRIAAEEAEAGDGLLNDVADFIGRGPVISEIFGSGAGPNPEAAKARELAAKDAHQYALEKAEKAATALKQEVNTLHTLTEQYNKLLQARLDNETKVKRLLVHFRNNIFYYMQAIWNLEPPDQRLLRLHNVPVPVLELESRSYRVNVETDPDIFAAFREPGTERHRAFLHGTLKHAPNGGFETKPLVEVADIGNLICCIGNYMVFPLKAHNALTEFMAAPYVDSAFGAMDPDELSNVSLDDYAKYVCCLHDSMEESAFNAIKPQLEEWLKRLLAAPLRNGDEIVIPTGSLFIESLVDQHPILEDYKLKHRELDVFKVQEEVRKAGLENLRLAARLVSQEYEDPDIEKKIVLDHRLAPVIDVDNP